MAVDYTPTLGNYIELKPFRYWCQKVLPLVYDDSLSYYELLNKVVDYLNKSMEDVETLHGDVEALHTAYEQLQSYVNDYFDNLDVQEEINNKLDSLVLDGTMNRLISEVIGSTPTPIFVNSLDQMTDTDSIYVLLPNGYIYYWNGSVWVNTNMVYGLSDNTLKRLSATVTADNYTTLNIDSVDNQPINTIATYHSSFINLSGTGVFPPNATTCTVMCYVGFPNAETVIIQICTFYLNNKVMCYIREKIGDGWVAWEDMMNRYAVSSLGDMVTQNNYSNLGISSVDNQPVDTVVTYDATYVTAGTHGTFPENCRTTCTIIHYNGHANNLTGSVQIAVWEFGASLRYHHPYGWANWFAIPRTGGYVRNLTTYVTANNYTSLGITSVDAQPINTIVTYNSSFIALPTSGTFPVGAVTCTVLSFVGFPSTVTNESQLCVFYNNGKTYAYIRTATGNGWMPWQDLTGEYSLKTFGSAVTANNYTTLGITSLDTQPVNTVVTYTYDYMQLDDTGTFPEECDGVCTVICYNGQRSLSGGSIQIASWQNGNSFRFLTGNGWGPWKTIVIPTKAEQRYLENVTNYVGTCVNKPITLNANTDIFVFGDSITTDSHGGFTWCSLICSKFGCTEHNYGVGGAPFSESSPIAIINQVETAKNELPNADLIFVAGGVNDFYMYDGLRTAVQNVINRIRTYNATAEIIFITPIRSTQTDRIALGIPVVSGIICNTALMNHCSVINGYDFPIATETTDIYQDVTDGDGTHPNATGKWIYATSVINAIL